MAAVIASMFTVFVKSELGEGLQPVQPTSETGSLPSDQDYKLASGAILDLVPGESIEIANPMRPNNAFDPFVLALCRQIGVALELPYEIFIKHFTASYSAARAAMLEAWRFFRVRRDWLAYAFCQPAYDAVIAEAVPKGDLLPTVSLPTHSSKEPISRRVD
jgi:capsid protein